jgi:hypothetical protein
VEVQQSCSYIDVLLVTWLAKREGDSRCWPCASWSPTECRFNTALFKYSLSNWLNNRKEYLFIEFTNSLVHSVINSFYMLIFLLLKDTVKGELSVAKFLVNCFKLEPFLEGCGCARSAGCTPRYPPLLISTPSIHFHHFPYPARISWTTIMAPHMDSAQHLLIKTLVLYSRRRIKCH